MPQYSTTTDSMCRDCEHMHPDREGGRWCSSPQLLKFYGRSVRCVWERDNAPEPERSHEDGTGKCGQEGKNFKRKEAY